MRYRIMPIVFIVLLGVTGCTTVTLQVKPLPRVLLPAGNRSPSPLELQPVQQRPSQPQAREELSAVDKAIKPDKKPRRDRPGPSARMKTPVLAPRPVQVPPAQAIRKPPVRQAPASPQRPRPVVKPPAAPAKPPATRRQAPRKVQPVQPRKTYDMRDVCAASTGITDPSITALCIDRYGR